MKSNGQCYDELEDLDLADDLYLLAKIESDMSANLNQLIIYLF